jgi:hypothetical protein
MKSSRRCCGGKAWVVLGLCLLGCGGSSHGMLDGGPVDDDASDASWGAPDAGSIPPITGTTYYVSPSGNDSADLRPIRARGARKIGEEIGTQAAPSR